MPSEKVLASLAFQTGTQYGAADRLYAAVYETINAPSSSITVNLSTGVVSQGTITFLNGSPFPATAKAISVAGNKAIGYGDNVGPGWAIDAVDEIDDVTVNHNISLLAYGGVQTYRHMVLYLGIVRS